jgi:hypothetical protein
MKRKVLLVGLSKRCGCSWGLNLADPPAFGLILIGDEYLLGTLRLRQHRSLFSRIASHFSLSRWPAAQVTEYVQQSLAAVGITRPAVEPAALNLLTSASGGLARSLCLLCRAAWIEAASAGAQTIRTPSCASGHGPRPRRGRHVLGCGCQNQCLTQPMPEPLSPSGFPANPAARCQADALKDNTPMTP